MLGKRGRVQNKGLGKGKVVAGWVTLGDEAGLGGRERNRERGGGVLRSCVVGGW